jgi:hypothetical protein
MPANRPSYMCMHSRNPVFPTVPSFYFCFALSDVSLQRYAGETRLTYEGADARARN